MDTLSDILSTIRVDGSLFSRAALSAPWSVFTPPLSSAIFHVVLRGSGWVRLLDGTEEPWSAGDLILLPHGDHHEMCSEPGVKSLNIGTLAGPRGADGLACVQHGGGGPTTSLLCGTFRFGPDGRAFLLERLPRLLVVRGHAGPTARWLDHTLQLMADEVNGGQPGADLLVSRLADILFVQVLRGWSRQQPEGWLGALNDPQLGRALGLIHSEPGAPWTTDTLARRAGLSRSALYNRFQEQLGEPPRSYLTRWRMVLARRALRGGELGMAEVAEQVGYGSEAAFSRAFKRSVGESPAAWRRQAAQGVARSAAAR
ncbi:MAG: AraC family transcriptional regulator [Alphaproteobacteria bacterium]|nr:AraC family transcriptional regulator [Alphaproteobacteria bacterium]